LGEIGTACRNIIAFTVDVEDLMEDLANALGRQGLSSDLRLTGHSDSAFAGRLFGYCL